VAPVQFHLVLILTAFVWVTQDWLVVAAMGVRNNISGSCFTHCPKIEGLTHCRLFQFRITLLISPNPTVVFLMYCNVHNQSFHPTCTCTSCHQFQNYPPSGLSKRTNPVHIELFVARFMQFECLSSCILSPFLLYSCIPPNLCWTL